jgi:hypothetical protein
MTKKGGKDFGPMEAMLYMAAQFTGEMMFPPTNHGTVGN